MKNTRLKVSILLLTVGFLPPCSFASNIDFTGFWKEYCTDAFGVQIKPFKDGLYSICFCGPGGCASPGEWMPNSKIERDPLYKIIDQNTIEVYRGNNRWDHLTKCTTETNPVLDYSTMPADKPAGRNIIFFESYKGLPDYEKNPPFNVTEMKIHRELKNLLSTINTPTKECVAKEVNVPNSQNFPLKTNICDSSDFDKILALVIRLAPTLDKKNLTFWKIDVDQDGESKLLIGYIDISKDKHFQYPYLSLWLLKFIDNRYKATYAGPFLSGTIHAIRQFGQDAKNNMVFVQHLSCIECHPWVYLTIIDFSKQPEGAFFEFTYSETHSNFKPTIEYELPGMGHSVDAKVESRVPNPPNVEGPHLIQNFKLEDGTEEWWEFTCKGYKCDYNFSKGYAPEKLYKLWKGADKL